MKVFDPTAIRRRVGFTDLIDPVAATFAEFSQGLGSAPIMVFAPAGSDGDVHVKAAWLPGRAVFTVKVATWFAARATGHRPPSSGFVAVHDATTGDLVALLQDEHHLTDIRTAAAGAVATRLLATERAHTLAVLGTGTQAYLQTLAACAVRPIDTVMIWGRSARAARSLRTAITTRAPHVDVSTVDRADLAIQRAQIVVTATSSRQPILRGAWLKPGQHITAVGADDPTKAELDASCFARADLLAVDSRDHTPRLAGDLHNAISAGTITADDIHAEIGDLVLAHRPGRRSDSQITVAKLIGLGVQDLVAAEVALSQLLDTSTDHRPPPASVQDLSDVAE